MGERPPDTAVAVPAACSQASLVLPAFRGSWAFPLCPLPRHIVTTRGPDAQSRSFRHGAVPMGLDASLRTSVGVAPALGSARELRLPRLLTAVHAVPGGATGGVRSCGGPRDNMCAVFTHQIPPGPQARLSKHRAGALTVGTRPAFYYYWTLLLMNRMSVQITLRNGGERYRKKPGEGRSSPETL